MHGIIYLVGSACAEGDCPSMTDMSGERTDMMERTTLPSLQVPYVQWGPVSEP